MESSFAFWQPIYACHGIPIFPVDFIKEADGKYRKKPSVSNYLRMGLPASASLVRKFGDWRTFGFRPGERSKVVILDLDSPDEKLVGDAMSVHGHTPLVVRSGGEHQGHHLYYCHRGEARSINVKPGIDILGGGYVVASPSWGSHGRYEIIQGSLDDLDRLPPLSGLDRLIAADPVIIPDDVDVKTVAGPIPHGKRNSTLVRRALVEAVHCDDYDSVLAAVTDIYETECEHSPPTSDTELAGIAQWAWGKQVSGQNGFAKGAGVNIPNADCDRLDYDPDALTLLLYLRRFNFEDGTFLIAMDAMTARLGWTFEKLRRARDKLIAAGLVKRLTRGGLMKGGQRQAALYQWERSQS
jgi:hypothetical protein